MDWLYLLYFINMAELTQIGVLIFLTVVFLLILFWKERKTFSKNSLILEVSEIFQKELKRLILEETKNNLSLAREKILKEHQSLLKENQTLFEELKKEFRERNEEIKKLIFLFNQRLEEEIDKLKKIGQESQDQLSKKTEDKTLEMMERFEKIYFDISTSLFNEAKEMEENLGKEIVKIYQSSYKALEDKIKKAEAEIENYKQEKMKELDKKVYLALGEIAKKTLGKTIDLTTHETLVMEALKNAKQELF